MAGIRLEWAQFGDFDSFDVLRSNSPMDIGALPSPIATGLPTMFYVDTSVTKGATYYYRVVAWRDGVNTVSGEIKAIADRDEHWNNVVALLHFDDNLVDETGKIWNKSGGLQYQNGAAGFGKKLVFNNQTTNDYVAVANSPDFDFGTNDFTIECFVEVGQISGAGASAIICRWGAGPSTNVDFIFFADSARKLNLLIGSSFTTATTSSLLIATRYHVAISRSANIIRIFVDGNIAATGAFTGAVPYSPSQALRIGRWDDSSGYFDGTIDELRITKGIARYTANFTPPDAPFLSN